MAEQDAFVRHEMLAPEAPPARETGATKWLRENLFNGWVNSALTVIAGYIVVSFILEIVPWFSNSAWNANSLAECREIAEGACFAVIRERWQQFLFGFYPSDQYWRPVLAFLLLIPALAPVLFEKVPRQTFYFTAAFPFIAYWLIWGLSIWYPVTAALGFVIGAYAANYASKQVSGVLSAGIGVLVAIIWWAVLAAPVGTLLNMILPIGLSSVESREIGGFTLTLILGVTCISLSLPIGILLALGRMSDLFIIKVICTGFIELIRGVPLITLLFVASVLLAYFLPPGNTFDLIMRVVIMVTAFASAYIAEVIRGGLAALPKGQYEAADALGLDYPQAMRLIILPQALKISIPGIVNVFIGLFKDTTLVSVISMFDPLGIVTPIRADADWNGIIWELYGFVALVFFVFCYGMSQYSQYLERKLQTGHR
ncbi:MAG: amino acid ABC transporter permease [Pseudomonadota bacterium]